MNQPSRIRPNPSQSDQIKPPAHDAITPLSSARRNRRLSIRGAVSLARARIATAAGT